MSIALGYTAYTLAMQVLFGTETWSERGEGFAVYFNFFSRISPWERRGREIGLRPPLGGLPRLDPITGTVFFVVVMIGTVTFDGLSQGSLWTDLSVDIARAVDGIVGAETAPKVAGTSGSCSPSGWSGSSTGSASTAPAPSAATSTRRRSGAPSSTRSCRSRSSTSPRTT